ncbi:YopX family protein [Naasia lichenicola]|uniref:YopX protein domain-containing protein n=1 Tax=Naasia lichenicola TaxID=2565933 RepID=A0A4S4FKM6_9MICO|nr:YopX family protein [Naasia lichenicola]THG30698.1 hypothetical protein E6C64_08645 [Naasia lichenicola]THG31935.1 hypothetical protein E6C64_07790 [Naasia lichenicola]
MGEALVSRVTKFRAWQPHASLHLKPGMYLVDDMVWYLEQDGRTLGGEVFLTRHLGTSRSSEFFEDVEIMQFTGLIDKNGVEIYEGDIIDSDHNFGGPFGATVHRGTIVYEHARYLIKTGIVGNDLTTLYRANWKIEVIGNIHENPELLSGGEAS